MRFPPRFRPPRIRPPRLRPLLAAAAIGLAATAWSAGPAAADSVRLTITSGPGPYYGKGFDRGHHHGHRPHFAPPRHRWHGGWGYRRPPPPPPPRHGYWYGPPRVHHVLPVNFIFRVLLHDFGYRTVQSAFYKPARYWKGHGPAYARGAYVAIAFRPNGRYVVHLDPYSGRVIRQVYAGRW